MATEKLICSFHLKMKVLTGKQNHCFLKPVLQLKSIYLFINTCKEARDETREDEVTIKELKKIKPLGYTNKRMIVIISPFQP